MVSFQKLLQFNQHGGTSQNGVTLTNSIFCSLKTWCFFPRAQTPRSDSLFPNTHGVFLPPLH